MAIGIERAILLETDGGEWDPVSTAAAIAETIEAQEAANGEFELILFGNEAADTGDFQVGVRVAVALGRPMINGIKGIAFERLAARGSRPARGARRRLGDVRAAAARGPRREGGPEPAALPIRAGPAAGKEEGDRAGRARRVAVWRGSGSARARTRPATARCPGRRSCGLRLPAEERTAAEVLGQGPEAAPAVVDLLRPHRRPGAMSGSRMSGPILAFVEHAGGEPDRLSLEAVALARGSRRSSACRWRRSSSGRGADAAAPRLGSHGVCHDRVADELAPRRLRPGGVGRGDPRRSWTPRAASAVVAAGSERGNEVVAHVAARPGLPMAANVVEVDARRFVAARPPALGGSLLEDAALDAPVRLLTVAPHAVAVDRWPTPAPAPTVERFRAELEPRRSRRPASSGREAPRVAAASRSRTPRSSSAADAASAVRGGLRASSRSSPVCWAAPSAGRGS